ncbi:MAG: hypothetical protein E7262_03520 [Lachnospiraceae bacterium]|nr:hypothetical protein [Lachnospiraceae bacterium]
MVKLNKKNLLSCALALSVIASTFCMHLHSKADTPVSVDTTTDYASISRDTTINIDTNGVLEISRNQRENEQPMGEKDTWSLFIYMTGSNLEADYECASLDLDEMLRANFTEENIKNLNVIIQTGGCKDWHSNRITSNQIGRYTIDPNSNLLKCIERLPNASMGSPNTLYDFLNWGITNYPAEKMGVIFWNHGSGVSNGLCFDENFEEDSLSVHELEYTFAKINKQMTSKFELVAFDTCLSGSLEYANILAPYANYMVASADVAIAKGFYYTKLLNYILENPSTTGRELGQVICDSTTDFLEDFYQRNPVDYTFCTYDLSKVDNACIEINYLTKFLYDKLTGNPEEYLNLKKFQSELLVFDRDSVDIGSIIYFFETSSMYNYDITNLKKAFEDLIIYSRIKNKFDNDKCALGLTLYMPFEDIAMVDLNEYRNLAFSPYLLKYIEYMTYFTKNKTIDNFVATPWETSPYFFETNFNFLNYDGDFSVVDRRTDVNNEVLSVLNNNPQYVSDGFPNTWYSNVTTNTKVSKNTTTTEETDNAVKLITKNNTISTILAANTAKQIKNIYSTVWTTIDDTLVCLGQKDKAIFNPTTGEVTSSPITEWFMLPDGQLLTSYIINSNAYFTLYSFPVYINDRECSIRVLESLSTDNKPTYTTLGVWDGNDSSHLLPNSTYSRGYLPLEKGTTITPIYDIYDNKTGTYDTLYGEEYTIEDEFEFYFTSLENNYYSFAYEIEELDNDVYYSQLIPLN